MRRFLTAAALALCLGAAGACDSDDATAPGTTATSSSPVSGGPNEIVSFGLVDSNPTSATVDKEVTPKDYLGRISGWYFTHATWSYCRSQFGFLAQLQTELAADGRTIALLAVNEAGHESGLPTMGKEGTLPILQDTASTKVWTTLPITYRDVVILDAEGRWVDVFNLTANDLAKPENYAALKQKLLDAAQ